MKAITNLLHTTLGNIYFFFYLIILHNSRFLQHKENNQSHIKHPFTRNGIYWSRKPDITKPKGTIIWTKMKLNHDILTCKKMYSVPVSIQQHSVREENCGSFESSHRLQQQMKLPFISCLFNMRHMPYKVSLS